MEIKVEIGQYREVNKGALKASFSVIIHPQGQKILECLLFEANGRQWFSFPAKEKKGPEGTKSDFIPYISYINKEYKEKLSEAILNALKEVTITEDHGKAQNAKTDSGKKGKVQSDASPVWF